MDDFEDDGSERVQDYTEDGNDIAVSFKLSTDRICDAIDAVLKREVRDQVSALVSKRLDVQLHEIINGKLAAMVEGVLATEIVERDVFGKPKGESKALEEIIYEGMTASLGEYVDYEGRTAKDHYSRKFTRLEWLVRQISTKEIVVAAKQAVVQVQNEAEARIKADTAKVITEQLEGFIRRGKV